MAETKPQPYALKLANSRRRLLSLARSYGREWDRHNGGAGNTSVIEATEEALEAHVLEHGLLMDKSKHI